MANEQRDSSSNATDDVLKLQLSIYIDLYKQHFDYFIKCAVIYLAIVGAVSGYIFTSSIPGTGKAALAILIIFVSLVALLGCHLSRKWVLEAAASVQKVCTALNISSISLAAGLGVIRVTETLTGLILVAAIFAAILFRL